MTIFEFTYQKCPICYNPLRLKLGPIRHHECTPSEVRIFRKSRGTPFRRIT